MTDSVVHIVNGASVATSLVEADLPGTVLTWADALDQGPVPADGERAARAAFWATRTGRPAPDLERELAAADDAVDAAAASDAELVLWYEHDLFDQLALVRLLARIAARPRAGAISLVSIDRHPEVPAFLGLGQLEAHQLAALWPRRVVVAREALDEAAATWVALTAADPRALLLLARRARALPFLGAALERHLEEFPDRSSGLSRTERTVLTLCAGGVTSPAAVMADLHNSDVRYTATDTLVGATLGTLRELGYLSADGAVTATGRDALAARLDRVATAGIDTWRGGVHLVGRGPLWRWDAGERRLVVG